jgi:hypothetical protein
MTQDKAVNLLSITCKAYSFAKFRILSAVPPNESVYSITWYPLHHLRKILTAGFICLIVQASHAQDSSAVGRNARMDSIRHAHEKLHLFSGQDQVDILDVGGFIIHWGHVVHRQDSTVMKVGKVYVAALPSAQYTLQTGFAVSFGGNAAFLTSDVKGENISDVTSSLNYSQHKQFYIPLTANIWTDHNRYNILTDWVFSIFPQNTYGLGGFTTEQDGYPIDYNQVRLDQTVLKTIAPNFYLGAGYNFEYFWNVSQTIQPTDTITDWDRYGFSKTSISSGPTLNVLYDERRNPINPFPGNYANLVLRSSFTFLGGDNNWTSLLVDLRKYVHFPASSNNTFAFWSYNLFTLSGKPPYLLLPYTACDEYANLGRGYVQGRFRGTNLVYLETEYRYRITSNGFVSGVLFVNAQSYTGPQNNQFQTILPGWGAGLRIKFNKFSKTNVCLDYGWGINGSHGIFANLGEVF